ncbi:MAG: hypothetical protein NTU95_02085 [Methanothrix sp.]|nr:hypothetical protein [Methanothrix sp.]
MSNISAGQVSMLTLRLRLLLAAICKRRRTNPTTELTELTEFTEDAQRLLVEIHWGHLTHYPILKVHDKLLIAAGPPVGCLGEGGLPTGPGLASGGVARAQGPAARARILVGEADRARGEGAGDLMSGVFAGFVSNNCSVCDYY